jgi:hypothetical protein
MNAVARNEEELLNHLQDINTGLVALLLLPSQSRPDELLKEKQSVNNVEAQIYELLEEGKKIVTERDNWKQELTLTQQSLMEMNRSLPEYNHEDLEKNGRTLGRLLGTGAPAQVDLTEDFEDAQAQLVTIKKLSYEIGNR